MAWEQLLKQSPSNEDLRYIIEYVPESRNVAGEQLLKQSPSNSDLRYIIEYVPESRNVAHLKLCKKIGVNKSSLPNELDLIKEIGESVISRPGSLKMDSWHCGTSHCLAGWAAVLSETARKIELLTDTETAGCIVIPNYSNLFFENNECVLNKLKEIVEK